MFWFWMHLFLLGFIFTAVFYFLSPLGVIPSLGIVILLLLAPEFLHKAIDCIDDNNR